MNRRIGKARHSAHILALGFIALAGFSTGVFAAGPDYPLKVSTNHRYLIDQKSAPFLIVGDSPQALIGNLSVNQAKKFIANRARYGVNTLWINLLCDSYTACNADGTTFDGIAPFTVAGDLSTPNPAYFARADAMINLAASYGMTVLLDPIETGGWLGVLQANGMSKAAAYGRYLGQRYKNFKNIIWMSGNDFQSWRNPSDNALVAAVAKGIKQEDTNHLHTAELDYYVSATLDDPAFKNIAELDAVYTYRPTYAKILSEYRRAQPRPIFMVEANYEFEQNGGTDGGSLLNLRHQEYWTMLSGATGQLYGSAYSWRLQSGWQTNLNTPGMLQLSFMRRLFASRKWYMLVPDHAHKAVTAGFGVFSDSDSITTDTYATAARTPDGSLLIVYMPTIRTITVDMTRMAGSSRAYWYDPTDGTFAAIAGSPFSNSGSRHFRPPGQNKGGDGDWVLLIEHK